MSERTLKTLGRYNILRIVGRGAMGIVYEAIDPEIDRVVAIKTINLMLSAEEMVQYEARFKQEIKAAGKLNHPNIVTIYDVGKTDNFAYMAMEFINGCELKDLLKVGSALPTDVALDIVAQAAEGLAFAHSRDIIHRDVKPANIMLLENEDGLVAKITDFGIARMPASAVKTMTGMVMGSPRYMSPEQVVGRNLSARSDIFSLGVVLYEALTGTAPFESDTISSIMYQTVHVAQQPPSYLNPKLDPELDAIVAKALAKSPEDRFDTMKAFSRKLREVLRSRSGATSFTLAQLASSRGMPAVPPPSPDAGEDPPASESDAPRLAVATTASADRPLAQTIPPAAATVPPIIESVKQLIASVSDDLNETRAWPVTVSSQFDSTSATLRLAEITGQIAELSEFISASRQIPAFTDTAGTATNAPIAPPAIVAVDAVPAAPPVAPPTANQRAAITLTMDPLPVLQPRRVPKGPLVLLGGMAATVLALAVALAMTF